MKGRMNNSFTTWGVLGTLGINSLEILDFIFVFYFYWGIFFWRGGIFIFRGWWERGRVSLKTII